MYTIRSDIEGTATTSGSNRSRLMRIAVFLCVFLVAAAAGLIYDYSRPAVYRANSRLLVEPPGSGDDPIGKAQFAISEAQALRRSDLMQQVALRLKEATGAAPPEVGELERRFTAEAVPNTAVIELRGDGPDRNALVVVLKAWIEVYSASRKDTDRQDETDAIEEARHGVRVAQKAVDDRRREIDVFKQRHGIVSIERDENLGASRLKGLHTALNDTSTREVNAEAKVKAMTDSIAQGQGVIRAADKSAIANLEMRAVDLREKIKDLESDYTAQYLALDPKFKALRANLARVEQQIEQEKARSQKAALIEVQEEYAGAQRASQKIREQVDSLKQESQAFSTRFVELRRMASELEQLQETRRAAVASLAKLESARKPSTVKIRVLSAPSADEKPVEPNYSRDAAIALGGALALAIAAVWLLDYLQRETRPAEPAAQQPIIQIAYPQLQPNANAAAPAELRAAPQALLGAASDRHGLRELPATDISTLWRGASSEARLIMAAVFAGIAPAEIIALRWKDVDSEREWVEVPGASARRLRVIEPLRQELTDRVVHQHGGAAADAPLLADAAGQALDEAALDEKLMLVAHDAGLRHPEEFTGQALHFTYAAYLARQGIRMADLATTVGRVAGSIVTELMRLAPPGQVVSSDHIERVYPSFRLS